MELTIKENEVKDFMFEVFVPCLHRVISNKNPEMYEKWGGNACRQTAIFGAYYLQNILLPEYEWEVWDGIFEGPHDGNIVRWNHAWIYGKNGNKRLFLDLSNMAKERLFIATPNNRYPKDHSDYKDVKELSRERLDWDSLIKTDIEYYTSFTGLQFIQALDVSMKLRMFAIQNGLEA